MAKITRQFGIEISDEIFRFTTGLRIYEVTEFWKSHLNWHTKASTKEVAEAILDEIIRSAKTEGSVMSGAEKCIHFLKEKGVKIGLATSSPLRMTEALLSHFKLTLLFDKVVSADSVKFGKPHPGVFLACAQLLEVSAESCVALEDSINGLIAAKAARMKVVAVPEPGRFDDARFSLADIRLASLQKFNEAVWKKLSD